MRHAAVRSSRLAVNGAIALGLALIPVTARALDFRLHATTVEEDGFTREHSYFQGAPGATINIDLPRNWSSTSDPSSITVASRTANNTQIKVEKSSLAPDLAFKDKGLETYRKYAVSSVPQGAGNQQIVQELDAPLTIFGWKDYEIITSYDLFGQSYKRSALFINLNAKDQIVVTTVSPADTYAATRRVTIEMMSSWSPQPLE